ncbi:hypothetical protein [Paractinoplanes brasiliensis]|uniref:HNH endonuclease n=1 Tax=Paractinoplanes brasiliensis TaxID=52695 RepID=A0A4R6JSE3_9ACTN|nr:hypothetical protein [Actinoplanes brasiliensis]TDO39524.1 hypothetical protein C8E87_3215 [Actinoplanes brasiliensis]GID29138.1 hypothetical protein Abr02nite_41210 [Actinoplanes brasiliensis]
MGDRNYSPGCEKALFMLSRGHCYMPECQTRVMRFVNEEWEVKVEIAHIRGLKRTSARYDATMTDPERNHFRNLILLCEPHHKVVDRKANERRYTVDLLTEWKEQVEGDLSDELDEIDWLTQDRLTAILADAIDDTHADLTTALTKVHGIGAETLGLLKQLVADAFTRPYLDAETAESLRSSAEDLRHLPTSAEILSYSAQNLSGLPDSAEMLMYSSSGLQDLPYSVESLNAALRRFDDVNTQLSDTVTRMQAVEGASEELQLAAQRVEGAHQSVRQLADASARIADMADTARALETAAQEVRAATQVPKGGWSWHSFRWGMIWCFIAVLALLITYSWAKSQS